MTEFAYSRADKHGQMILNKIKQKTLRLCICLIATMCRKTRCIVLRLTLFSDLKIS
jgi:hypothetical protein